MTKDEALELALEAFDSMIGRKPERVEQAITAIKEALAQPEQKPVATIDSLEQEIYENTREFVSLNVMEWLLNRLNTTPIIKSYLEKDNSQRTWVDLTDGVMCDIAIEHGLMNIDWIDFARAIEAKLRSKNT